MAAFKQFLLSLEFNTKNIGIADRLQAQGQHGRAGIAAANADDWVGMNGVIIPAPAAPAAPSRPKTASRRTQTARPSMLVLREWSHPEFKWDEGAQCTVWIGRS